MGFRVALFVDFALKYRYSLLATDKISLLLTPVKLPASRVLTFYTHQTYFD